MTAWFAIAGLVAALLAIRAHRSHSSALDRLGGQYHVLRWEGESNRSYESRIKNRILINGGRTW